MGNLTLNGATSGQITLAPPSVAGTNTISLPAQTATVLTDSSAAMNIGSGQIYKDASGNVGIGTSSPSYKLQVKGSSGAQSYLSIHDGTGDTTVSGNNAASLLFQARDTSIRTIAEIDAVNTTTNGTGGAMVFQTRVSDTLAERMRIDSSGNLLVGTTSVTGLVTSSQSSASLPSVAARATSTSFANDVLQIYCARDTNTSAYNYILAQRPAGVSFVVRDSGNVQNANNSYGALSDVRIKENVIDATPKLADLMKVKVRNFNYINDAEKTKQIGVIAQELETVFPSLVDEDSEGTKGVKYSVFVPMLIKAIQEQQAIISDLQSRIAALEAK